MMKFTYNKMPMICRMKCCMCICQRLGSQGHKLRRRSALRLLNSGCPLYQQPWKARAKSSSGQGERPACEAGAGDPKCTSPDPHRALRPKWPFISCAGGPWVQCSLGGLPGLAHSSTYSHYSERMRSRIHRERHMGEAQRGPGPSFQEALPGGVTQNALNSSSNKL